MATPTSNPTFSAADLATRNVRRHVTWNTITGLAVTTALTFDQVRGEHGYAVGVQAAVWGRP